MSVESNALVVDFFNDPFVFAGEYGNDFDDDEPDEVLDDFDDDSEMYEEAFEEDFNDFDEPYDDVEAEDGVAASLNYDEDELLEEDAEVFDDEDLDE
ncbi:MAG: hypothetical protein ACTTKL_01945 [Treponema sp.]